MRISLKLWNVTKIAKTYTKVSKSLGKLGNSIEIGKIAIFSSIFSFFDPVPFIP